jgi:hypothetical protein
MGRGEYPEGEGMSPWVIKAAHGEQAQAELEAGKKVEMEHSGTIKWLIEQLSHSSGKSDKPVEELVKEMATKIAEDHLKEMPDYYSRLKDMESAGKRKEGTDKFHKNLQERLKQ